MNKYMLVSIKLDFNQKMLVWIFGLHQRTPCELVDVKVHMYERW